MRQSAVYIYSSHLTLQITFFFLSSSISTTMLKSLRSLMIIGAHTAKTLIHPQTPPPSHFTLLHFSVFFLCSLPLSYSARVVRVVDTRKLFAALSSDLPKCYACNKKVKTPYLLELHWNNSKKLNHKSHSKICRYCHDKRKSGIEMEKHIKEGECPIKRSLSGTYRLAVDRIDAQYKQWREKNGKKFESDETEEEQYVVWVNSEYKLESKSNIEEEEAEEEEEEAEEEEAEEHDASRRVDIQKLLAAVSQNAPKCSACKKKLKTPYLLELHWNNESRKSKKLKTLHLNNESRNSKKLKTLHLNNDHSGCGKICKFCRDKTEFIKDMVNHQAPIKNKLSDTYRGALKKMDFQYKL